MGRQYGVEIDQEDMHTLLYFERDCFHYGHDLTQANMSKHVNILAHSILCEVTTQIEEDLVEHMQIAKNWTNEDAIREGPLAEAYSDLAEKLMESAVTRTDRLIDYVAVEKGQYWLQHVAYSSKNMASMCVAFNAEYSVDRSDRSRFCPPDNHAIEITLNNDTENFVCESDWKDVHDYVKNNSRPNLINTLLSSSFQQAANGYHRSAILEAYSALECALSEFSGRYDATPLSDLDDRMDSGSIKKAIEKLGVSGTLRILVPLLIDKGVLDQETLESCLNASLLRQNIAHNGQRNVSKPDVHRSLESMAKMCAILQDK